MSADAATFILLAFNQAAFIADAVRSVFAQTHRPLRVILSDDASTDDTFAIMQSLARSYTGPHDVLVRRNETNQGMVPHYNTLMSLAEGPLVIVGAGDDLSAPERVARLHAAWRGLGAPAEAALYSDMTCITADGRPAPRPFPLEAQPDDPAEVLRRWGGSMTGATCALTRALFDRFGPLRTDLPCEDIPMVWRGALAGHLHLVPEPLVKWRIGTGVSGGVFSPRSPAERLADFRRWVEGRSRLAEQARQDLATVPDAPRRICAAARKFRVESRAVATGVRSGAWRMATEVAAAGLSTGWLSPVCRQTLRRYVVCRLAFASAPGRPA